jgi:hypothetical protein
MQTQCHIVSYTPAKALNDDLNVTCFVVPCPLFSSVIYLP